MKFTPFVFAQAEITAPSGATETVPAEAPAEAVAAEGADGAAAPAPAQRGGFNMMVPMLIIFGIFYFMMIRPQQRKEKERRKMIDELRAGARVVYAGGFVGTIVEANEKTFKIEMAPGVVTEVVRSSVQGLAE